MRWEGETCLSLGEHLIDGGCAPTLVKSSLELSFVRSNAGCPEETDQSSPLSRRNRESLFRDTGFHPARRPTWLNLVSTADVP